MNHKAFLFTILFCLYSVLQVSGQGLVSINANGNLVYKKYANQGQTNAVNTVPDFSMCGYMGGGVSLPVVPVVETLSPASGDDQSRIQAAIDRVAALPLQSNGFRGAVLLQKGTYEVAGTINITASGIVLRGEGQGAGGTKIIATGTGQRTLIAVKGTGSATEVSGSRQAITTGYVPVGSRSFTVASASGFSVGSKIMVLRTPNDQWINDLNMAQYGWTAEEYKVAYERVVTAKDGNTITVNAPIVQAMETKYGGGSVYLYTYPGRIEKVGIESLRLESAFVSDTDENHAWDGVKLQHIENGWVRNVTAQYFGYSCVYAGSGAKSITVEECAMLDPKSQTTGGRKYSFVIDGGQFILIQRCFTRGGRHDYVVQHRVPGPNAFVDCLAINVKSDIGPHHRYSTGSLFDNIEGGAIRVQNRGSSGTGHGWSGAQTMFWNCKSTSSEVKVESPLGALNWGIGCKGTQAGAGYWESFGTHVTPRSLYLKQLEERLGSAAVNRIAIPEQLAGTIWTALREWAGEGKPFATGSGNTEYTIDNTDAGFSTAGSWTSSTGLAGYYGSNYLHDGDNLASPAKSATWTSPITATGTYDVYMRWTSAADRPDAAPVEVNYNGGVANLTVNQKVNGGQWVKIGQWSFTGGSGDYVKLSASDAGYTIADAVRWIKVTASARTATGKPSADLPAGSEITAFPNPATHTLTISSPDDLTNAKISMSNSLGQRVSTAEVSRSAETVSLDVSELPDGVYLLSVRSRGKRVTNKIVISSK